MPLKMLVGYVAIAFFMTGDGFDLAFLSHYIQSLGFSSTESSLVFTVYGLTAAFSAWGLGVVAEILNPRRTMFIGFAMWIIFNALFLYFGLYQQNYALIILFYGLRGAAYPLFLYSFIVVLVHNIHERQISGALGWFWTVYSIGIGVAGSFIPSFTIPYLGEYGTLWLAMVFVAIGGCCLFFLRNIYSPDLSHLSLKEKFAELSLAITLFKKPQVCYLSFIRIVNTLSLFGFAVVMPSFFVDRLNFTTSEWLQIWSVFFFTTVFSNVFWGLVGEKIGWITTVRWCGCAGMALSSMLFYFYPLYFGHSFAHALVPAICMGIFVGCFVSVCPMLTVIEPNHKGAAVSVYNLSAGLSNFVAPAIATLVLPYFDIVGVVYAYTSLYLLALAVSFLLKVKQDGFRHHWLLGSVPEKNQETQAKSTSAHKEVRAA